MASVSEVEMSDYTSESSESSQEQSSEASEDSFVSANEDFLPYDENIEPIATEKEAVEYQEQMTQEEEEEEMLWSRFSGEEDVENWFVVLFIIFVACRQETFFWGRSTSGKAAYTFTHSRYKIPLPDM